MPMLRNASLPIDAQRAVGSFACPRTDSRSHDEAEHLLTSSLAQTSEALNRPLSPRPGAQTPRQPILLRPERHQV